MLFPVNHRHDRRHQGQKTFSLGEPSAIDGMAVDRDRIK